MKITVDYDGPVVRIGIDDGKVNAFSLPSLVELDAALDAAASDARAVLLVGRPGVLSAGFDLAVMRSGDAAMQALLLRGAELLLRVFTFPVPVVVACTGHALGFGGLLLLAADRRFGATGSFKVGLPEVGVGAPLPIFALELARYRMPPSEFDRVLLGTVHDPDQAARAGLLDDLCEPSAVVAAAEAAAHEHAQLERDVFHRSKLMARSSVVESIVPRMADDIGTMSWPAD